jgi:hypothetical protein
VCRYRAGDGAGGRGGGEPEGSRTELDRTLLGGRERKRGPKIGFSFVRPEKAWVTVDPQESRAIYPFPASLYKVCSITAKRSLSPSLSLSPRDSICYSLFNLILQNRFSKTKKIIKYFKVAYIKSKNM